ncbi:hypothetical protein GCM10023205_04280 [Yinghuangia aomiensis]|uniref:Uncharacterized protein n=1 Tax=Yinghuangia aomiensis TaxID=676205 RepID=A0ABP9GML8_9ACTN
MPRQRATDRRPAQEHAIPNPAPEHPITEAPDSPATKLVRTALGTPPWSLASAYPSDSPLFETAWLIIEFAADLDRSHEAHDAATLKVRQALDRATHSGRAYALGSDGPAVDVAAGRADLARKVLDAALRAHRRLLNAAAASTAPATHHTHTALTEASGRAPDSPEVPPRRRRPPTTTAAPRRPATPPPYPPSPGPAHSR